MNHQATRTRVPRNRRRPGRRGRSVLVAAIASALLVSCTPAPPERSSSTGDADASSPTTGTASAPSPATTAVTPSRGTVYFGGAFPEVAATVTLPPGWVADDIFVLKPDADPVFGLALFDVVNIYEDGCRWVLVDPPIGATVADLAAAYTKLPGTHPTVRDVTVDGYTGQQVERTIPDYDPDTCIDGKYGLLQDIHAVGGNEPSLWSQAPGQHNKMLILDIEGTRLQVLATYPPTMSGQERAELDAIISSLEIS